MLENVILLLTLIFFIGMAVSLLVFGQMTMRPIEKRMKADGISYDCQWLGGPLVFYALAISMPEKFALRIDPRLINSSVVRSYASSSDRLRGIIFIFFTVILLLMICIGVFAIE